MHEIIMILLINYALTIRVFPKKSSLKEKTLYQRMLPKQFCPKQRLSFRFSSLYDFYLTNVKDIPETSQDAIANLSK